MAHIFSNNISGYIIRLSPNIKGVVIVLVAIRVSSAFAIYAYSCDDLLIEITSDSSPAHPSKFLPLSLPGVPSSAGFLDICEPPHV